MARLHLLRRGTGNARVATSADIAAERVSALFAGTRIKSTDTMPTIDGEAASGFVDPESAVIELLQGEQSFGQFRSPGFNILVGVDPREAYRWRSVGAL